MRDACVLVLNYNGLEHLDACLGTLVEAAKHAGVRCPVVLVDNRSTDASVAIVRERFPSVEVVVSPRNDFLFSLNDVVRARTEEIVVIVNNDMRFDRQFVAALLPHFDDPRVFAVGAAIRTWDGGTDTVGPRCARVEHCWFYKWWQLDRQEPAETLDVCGGAAAFRRAMFVELGGFDPLYRPGYYEDLDLSYRAWARGWRAVFEPASRAFHKVSASMLKRHGQRMQDRLMYRNHVLFTAANVGGALFLAGFLLLLPLRALRPLARGDIAPLAGAVMALPRLPAALRRRLARDRGRLDLARFAAVTALDAARHA
jgi:GT2 family glycosyltransferase